MTRAAWLEDHDLFEGVGAHELNHRYDHVDGGDWDQDLRDVPQLERKEMRSALPALFRAQSLLAAVAPIRFDGADLSHHNADAGPIDWPTLRSASNWVATKATQSIGYVDPTFTAHRSQMAAQAFKHRSAYHWLSSTTDPGDQAAHYYDTVGPLLVGEGAMLDAEEGGITAAKCLAWLRAIEAETRRPCEVYTGAYVAGGTIWQSTEIRTSEFGSRPMHLAAYTTEAKALALPGVKAYPWSAWQYSSNGPVPGVVGRCDMNRVDNLAHYDLACGVNTEPVEDDMEAITFEVTDLPGIYLWASGMPAPVPFTNPTDLTIIATAMKAVACSAPISQEMYHRLFVVPPIDVDALAAKIAAALVIPPLTGHLAADLGAGGHITGSVG